MRALLFAFVFIFTFVFASAFASVSFAYERFHSLWDTPSLLNIDQTVVSFRAQGLKSERNFDSEGVVKAESYQQRLTWASILENVSATEKLELRKSLRDGGVREDSLAYSRQISVEREVYELNPFWGYGMTDQWNIGLRLPVQFSRSTVSYKTIKSEEFEALSKKYRVLQQSTQTPSSVDHRVDEQGSSQFDDTSIGDLELLSKVLVYKSMSGAVSTIQSISFPSSRGSDPYDPLARPSGDGQYDFGLGLAADYWLDSTWKLNTKASYVWQFSDRRDVRAPKFDSDDFDVVVVEDVKRDLGDVFEGAVAAGVNLQDGWSLSGGFLYYYKQQDKYLTDDPQVSTNERLGLKLLESSSEREYRVANLGVEFTSEGDRAIFDGKSKIGTQLNIYAPISGRNSSTSPAASLEVFYVY